MFTIWLKICGISLIARKIKAVSANSLTIVFINSCGVLIFRIFLMLKSVAKRRGIRIFCMILFLVGSIVP